MRTSEELQKIEDLSVKPSDIVDKPSTSQRSSDIILKKPVKSWHPLPCYPKNIDEGITPIYNKINTQENIPSIHSQDVFSQPLPSSQIGISMQEAKQISVESSTLELDDLYKATNTADKAKAASMSEGSHSMTFDLHQGQDSSSVDSNKKENVVNEEHEDRLLIAHSFLFPAGYEFYKEELIRLWIAEGLFQKNQSPMDRVQDDASVKFDSFMRQGLIVQSRVGPDMDFSSPNVKKLLYKLHGSVESSIGPAILDGGYARVLDGNLDEVPEEVKHLCIVHKSFDDVKFNSIVKYKYLRTLFVLPYDGVSFKEVPRDLFCYLKNLTTLNFSHSRLSKLPISIGYVISLQYIDLSYTPIIALPNSIYNLHNLQTLKLRGCRNLFELPKGMRKLTNLLHLEFNVLRQLGSMPPGIGDLTNLQTSSAFLVGEEGGCKIRELKNTRNLTGSFCISRLNNVLDLDDVREASLIDKSYITILQLRWDGVRVSNSSEDERMLEHLQPPLCLKELSMLYYGGSKLPTWISDRSYECLVDLHLLGFKNCQVLPSLGDLPSLQFLRITGMDALERIDELFCRSGYENSPDHAFPCLKELTFEGLPKLEEWIGVHSGDFPCLHTLKLRKCPKLKSLPSLSCLRKSLKRLEFSYCQNVMPFLHGEEKVSLECLLFNDCPELNKCFDRSQGQDWPKIAHVPLIMIDLKTVSK